MSLHDLINKFEAEIASLLARFRSHPAVVAEATATEPPADFGPVSPDGSASPPNKPAEPPAPQVQDETPRPVNTTDPVAPGFQAPTTPTPEPAAPADNPFVPKPEMTYDYCMGQNLPADGPAAYTITDCPSRVQIRATQRTGMMALPYDLTVNGVTVHQDMVLATTPINTDGPTVTVSVSQPGDSHLTLGVGPAP